MPKIETLFAHAGLDRDDLTGSMNAPVYYSSTYRHPALGQTTGFDYSRTSNPTRKSLEDCVALLEHGSKGYAFASGMAAISSSVFAVVKSGDHIVVTRDIYGGAYRFFSDFLTSFGISFTFVDATDLNEIERAIRQDTRIVYIETPSNPLLTITDIRGVAALCREKGFISIIDNTFMSPYYQRPLELGIDISVHSATKFLGGHSDLLAGAAVTADKEIAKKIYFVQNTLGAVLSPHDSWLLMRGIKTLGARMKVQSETAMRLAQWLKEQKWVKDVYYPGLSGHKGYDLHASQACSPGAVLSFTTDTTARAHAILGNVKIWTAAVSLGGVDSIVSYPWIMSHGAMPAEVKNGLGITENLLRLSAGLESADDLINDLDSARS
jgi:cystathionine beta-lyase